ncbi:unnamed protein product, partial [Amoebophrya sp. A120]
GEEAPSYFSFANSAALTQPQGSRNQRNKELLTTKKITILKRTKRTNSSAAGDNSSRTTGSSTTPAAPAAGDQHDNKLTESSTSTPPSFYTATEYQSVFDENENYSPPFLPKLDPRNIFDSDCERYSELLHGEILAHFGLSGLGSDRSLALLDLVAAFDSAAGDVLDGR